MPDFACLPAPQRSSRGVPFLGHLRLPLAQHKGSTSVLERTECRQAATCPPGLNGGSQRSCHAHHSHPLPGLELFAPREGRKAAGARRPDKAAPPGPGKGLAGPPAFSGQRLPALPPPPAASTSQGPVSAGLTPPEEPAEPTHRDPSLSRLRPTASRTLPPCSREVLGSSLRDQPRPIPPWGTAATSSTSASETPITCDPTHQPQTHALLLKRPLRFPLYKKVASPSPTQNKVFASWKEMCRVMHPTTWGQWKSSSCP